MFANVKMKALSVAVLGLAGVAFSNASFAQCAASPAQPVGAWSAAVTTGGTFTITTPGLVSTPCKGTAAITANLGSASAFVRDDTAVNEGRYRAAFRVNLDNLTGQNSTQPVRIFAATTLAPAMSVPEVVKLSVFGNAAGTNKVLGIATACASAATGICSTTAPLGASGTHNIQIDWVKGAAGVGYLKVWVNNTTEATPTSTTNVDNNAWGGVDSAALGLASASAAYRAAQLNRTVDFDEFDSRRSTFIN